MIRLVEPGSFRGPGGFVFVEDGVLYRQVNACWRHEYNLLFMGCDEKSEQGSDASIVLVSNFRVNGEMPNKDNFAGDGTCMTGETYET